MPSPTYPPYQTHPTYQTYQPHQTDQPYFFTTPSSASFVATSRPAVDVFTLLSMCMIVPSGDT